MTKIMNFENEIHQTNLYAYKCINSMTSIFLPA